MMCLYYIVFMQIKCKNNVNVITKKICTYDNMILNWNGFYIF